MLKGCSGLLRRLEGIWQTIPMSKYTEVDLEIYGLERQNLDIIRWVWHDYLYTKFLLHKLIVSNGDGNHAELIQISHELVALHGALFGTQKNGV